MSTSTKTARKTPAAQRWSRHVTETSDAMDLKPDVFKEHDPKAIARSLKSSAAHSGRRKAGPYASAMSMLNFYINRAGHNLEAGQRRTLEEAKDVLRELFGRDEPDTKKAVARKVGTTKDATTKAGSTKGATKNVAAKKAAAKKASGAAATKARRRGPTA